MENQLIDQVYVIPTYNCNLKCPHCDLRLRDDCYNHTRFINCIKVVNSKSVVLFGGEPTLYKDRFNAAIDTGKITSISTNLVNIDGNVIDQIKNHNISVATSWNVCRFTNRQYQTWLANVTTLVQNDIDVLLMVTLTEDLINLDKKQLQSLLRQWKCAGIKRVRFEQLLDDNKSQLYYDQVDTWLLEVDDLWDNSFPYNDIVDQLRNWQFNCSSVYTIKPSGDIVYGCPQYKQQHIVNQCLTCDNASICKPCMLQQHCTFPRRLYKKYYA